MAAKKNTPQTPAVSLDRKMKRRAENNILSQAIDAPSPAAEKHYVGVLEREGVVAKGTWHSKFAN